MKLIVGLGNPGRLYINSRHNIGFQVVGALAKNHKISLKKENSIFSLSGKGKINGQNVILSKPLTYMNLSGIAVSALLKKYRIDLNDLLVVCDDLDLEFGRLKIRPSGSSGGHGGLKSIIDFLGNQSFCRLRIGIGRSTHNNTDPAKYVLSPFNKNERGKLNQVTKRALECCRVWLTEGVSKSMNVFNRWSKNEKI